MLVPRPSALWWTTSSRSSHGPSPRPEPGLDHYQYLVVHIILVRSSGCVSNCIHVHPPFMRRSEVWRSIRLWGCLKWSIYTKFPAKFPIQIIWRHIPDLGNPSQCLSGAYPMCDLSHSVVTGKLTMFIGCYYSISVFLNKNVVNR